MTRVHFEMIAKAINDARTVHDDPTGARNAALDRAAKNLAAELGRTNGRFDRDRFLTACGVK